MIAKKYNSFEEIDHRLKILKLQRKIDGESLKLNFNRTKESFYPTNLLGGFGGVLQKILITLIAKKIFKKFTR
ncbi:MAG: DUF6327 family protein [Sediminicola sp.]|tara:strand:+ start:23272 stop:23490 length:219 start_codon:yes stop_codon:yes gene_type:complete